jgi:hypothetical protein
MSPGREHRSWTMLHHDVWMYCSCMIDAPHGSYSTLKVDLAGNDPICPEAEPAHVNFVWSPLCIRTRRSLES